MTMSSSWHMFNPEEARKAAELIATTRAMIDSAPHACPDFRLPGILPNREYRVTRVTYLAEYNVLRVRYEIVPTDEKPSPENAELTRRYSYDGLSPWQIWVRDDVGTDYEDGGGACGVSPTTNLFDGEFDVRPAPPPEATWIEIIGRRSDTEPAEHVARLDLPLSE
jgi:hypothetical protein